MGAKVRKFGECNKYSLLFFAFQVFFRTFAPKMIPKIIHLCWFSNDPYPVEIKVCLDSWKRVIPDYQVKVWGYDDAKAIGCAFIDEALEARQWAFAADAVRFYAVFQEGGVYMDSDIYLYKRFDEFMQTDGFTTFMTEEGESRTGLQAAFFMASKGDGFCQQVWEYYKSHHFKNEDGTFNKTISPIVMERIAKVFHFDMDNRETQLLRGLHVYPTAYLLPRKKYPRTDKTFAEHRIYGSWRRRKLGRLIDLKFSHFFHVIRYALFKR